MAIAKGFIAFFLVSLLLVNLTEADQMTVEEHVLPGVSYRRDRTCARGRVGLAVPVAAVFLQALPVILRSAPATPT
ncbi:hypothetical protein FH972_013948 [Carpinus fangiana]|uniref:Uncharacterized protein n=1 Tax=Carpinus fangiana TaxID=176857 RepID=A0A5N6R8A1_9ROSI|nr:hypothetical protein FH972_013948 [Carpinus fangiana]